MKPSRGRRERFAELEPYAEVFAAPAPEPTPMDPVEPGELKIWRYLDFARLVSLLRSRKLFLPLVSALRDKLEGHVPAGEASEIWEEARRVSDGREENAEELFEREITRLERKRQHVAVSCWHQNEVESRAMWDVYLPAGLGVAIQTRVNRLTRSLAPAPYGCAGIKALLTRVDYDAHRSKKVSHPGSLAPFCHKHESYRYEHEIRLVVDLEGIWPGRDLSDHRPFYELVDDLLDRNGIYFDVDVEQLVERFVLPPECPNWVADSVKAVVEKFGCGSRIDHSSYDLALPKRRRPRF